MTAAPEAPATSAPGAPEGGALDRVVASSAWMLATMVLMSGGGMAFWLLAARLQAPAEVGYAGSLVTAMTVISLFAQVGLDTTLVQVLPRSSRPFGDVVTAVLAVAVVGGGLAAAYALLLGVLSPELAGVLGGGTGLLQLAFLVAALSVNALTDSALLAVSRLRANFLLNGVLMTGAKLALPVLLVDQGAMGLVLAFGTSALLAAVASVVVVLRAVSGPRTARPGRELLGLGRFAGAGYGVSVLDTAPFLVFPVLVVHAHGPASAAAYFVAFQVTVLLLAVGFTLSNAMYAEVSARPDEADAVVRRSGLLVLLAMSLGAAVLALAAPLVMRVFGPDYVDEGVPVLRVLAACAVVAGLCSWSALRLRVHGRLGAMLGGYAVGTVLVLVLAWWWSDVALWGVALAWGVGRGATLVVNLLLGGRR
ncbi:lipopolysaccharide biosynthesis protein [Nocardioides marmoraquaticus]